MKLGETANENKCRIHQDIYGKWTIGWYVTPTAMDHVSLAAAYRSHKAETRSEAIDWAKENGFADIMGL